MSDSYLVSLYDSSASAASDSLIGLIYNTGTTSSGGGTAYGITTSNPVTALQEAEATQTQGIAYTLKTSSVERTIQNFATAVSHATSVAQLLANPDVLNVLLTANDLGSETSYTALATKALESNTASATSLANQLTDTNWKSAAETYQFATKGLSVIQQGTNIAQLETAYAQVEWENSLDNAVPGLSDALAFKQELSSGTISSVDQILGDPVLRTVVSTTLGIPQQIAFQPLQAQEKAISSRLDITNFSTPDYVNTFIERYLLVNNEGSSSDAASLVV